MIFSTLAEKRAYQAIETVLSLVKFRPVPLDIGRNVPPGSGWVTIDKRLYSHPLGVGLSRTSHSGDLAGDEAQQRLGQLPAVQSVVETGIIDFAPRTSCGVVDRPGFCARQVGQILPHKQVGLSYPGQIEYQSAVAGSQCRQFCQTVPP